MVGAFAAAYPHLRIDFEMTDRKVDVLEEGFDVAVRVAKLASSTLLVRRLGRCERVLCASPDAGQGIALLPRFLAHEDLASGRLVSVLPAALDMDLEVMALLPPGRRIAAKARAFVDFVAGRLDTEPWWRPASRAAD